MNIYYADSLKGMTYDWCAARYPALNRRVYDALASLTPNQYKFVLNAALGSEKAKLKISHDRCDPESRTIAAAVLMELLSEPGLIVSEGDIVFAWCRFRELEFMSAAVNQGVFVEDFNPDSGTDYQIAGMNATAEARKPAIKKSFFAKSRYRF